MISQYKEGYEVSIFSKGKEIGTARTIFYSVHRITGQYEMKVKK